MLVAAAAAAAVAALGWAARQNAGFEGAWTLNRARTVLEYPRLADLDSATASITRVDGGYRLFRRFVVRGVPDTLSWTLTPGGPEVTRGGGERWTAARLNLSGDSLVFTARMVAPQGEAADTVWYWLGDGSRVLQGHERFRGPRFTYDNLWVLDRR